MKESIKKINKLQIPIDILTMIISCIFAYVLRFNSSFRYFLMGDNQKSLPSFLYTKKLIILIPLLLVIYCIFKLYTPLQNKNLLRMLFQIILANMCAAILFVFVMFLQNDYMISRGFLILFLVINIVLSASSRMLYSLGMKIMGKKQPLAS